MKVLETSFLGQVLGNGETGARENTSCHIINDLNYSSLSEK